MSKKQGKVLFIAISSNHNLHIQIKNHIMHQEYEINVI